jgi:hypothetical protein
VKYLAIVAVIGSGCASSHTAALHANYTAHVRSGPAITAAMVEARLNPTSPVKAPDLIIAGGTRVKVLAVQPDGAHVEVLEGDSKGARPWVHIEDLQQ